MKPRPTIYENVLIIGGGRPEGEAIVGRIGGRWVQPNLGLSYLLAARHVLEAGDRERRLNEVVLPAAYLQRHALEVALKDILDMAYVIKRNSAWLDQLTEDPHVDPEDPEEVPFLHKFDVLLERLTGAFSAVGFPPVPPEVVAMARRLTALEGSEPTRFRYLALRGREQSFPEAVLLPVGEIQEGLEDLFETVFAYQGDDVEHPNLVTSLAHKGMGLDEAIQRIGQ